MSKTIDGEDNTSFVYLTVKEVRCLELAAQGQIPNEIALSIAMSEDRVSYHLSNAESKLNAGNRFQAIVIALRSGMLHGIDGTKEIGEDPL